MALEEGGEVYIGEGGACGMASYGRSLGAPYRRMDPVGMLEVLSTLRADIFLYRSVEFEREEPRMLLAEGGKDILLQVGDGIVVRGVLGGGS